MGFIQVDYDNAIAQAKRLEAAADQCGEAYRAIRLQSGRSERFWQGNSGNVIRTKMAESVKELQAVQSDLRETAAVIRKVAEELRRKDKKLSGVHG